MARGFDSKFVSDQQEAAQDRRGPSTPVDPRRRGLELARADLQRRLEAATQERHREMLRQSLAAVDAELARLPS